MLAAHSSDLSSSKRCYVEANRGTSSMWVVFDLPSEGDSSSIFLKKEKTINSRLAIMAQMQAVYRCTEISPQKSQLLPAAYVVKWLVASP